jgi:hypothetical protein
MTPVRTATAIITITVTTDADAYRGVIYGKARFSNRDRLWQTVAGS